MKIMNHYKVVQGENFMFTNNKLAKSVRLALAFGVAATALPASQAFAADEEVEEVERIEVTGSRIKRTDLESASPIEVISIGEFEDQGRISVADALRNVTSNSFGSFIPSSGSSAQSQSTVSLLGAGSDRTLVLLDGKRLAGSPSLGGSSANLSSIPMAAVERIEILKTGASAVYGSDAIAGVINIILKKDYEGATFSINYSEPELDGSNTKTASLVLGMSSDKGNITFVYDHQENGIMFDGDRPYTAASMEDKNGDGLISIYDETVGISFYGATIRNPTTGAFEASPDCDRLANEVPGFVGVLDVGSALDAVGAGTVCGFAYANVSANTASTERDSIMTSASYNVTDDLEFFVRAMFSRTDSLGRYAPPAAGWNDIPVGNVHNPYDEEVNGYFRWYQIGNRDGIVTDYQQDYMVGFKGLNSFGDVDVDWEFSYHKAVLDYRQVGRSYLSYAGLYANLLIGEPLGSDDGIAAMKATTYQEDVNEFDHYFAGAGFELGELPGGMISHYVGYEFFEQAYNSQYDAQSEGGWIGGSAGNSAAGQRDTKAFFYEIALPVTDELLVSGAFRWDDYSDFGSQTTPSFKLEYRPMDDLLIRASYSEGFRAPSLSELLGATAFSATSATDYEKCRQDGIAIPECPTRQFDNLRLSNPNLGPEESTYINAGVVYSGVENLTVKVDYFSLEVENVISSISVQDLLNADYAGQVQSLLDQYPNLRFVRDSEGRIDGDIITEPANGAFMSRKGFDIELGYKFEFSDMELDLKSVTTYLTDSEADVYFGGPTQNFIGFAGQPDFRNQFIATLDWEALTVSWTTDYIHSTYMNSDLEVGDGTFNYVGLGEIDSFVTHNVNVAYDLESYGKVNVGVRNLTETEPFFDDNDNWIADTLYHSAHIGREMYVGYTISF
jgi:iron complex outermembrane receptor protein